MNAQQLRAWRARQRSVTRATTTPQTSEPRAPAYETRSAPAVVVVASEPEQQAGKHIYHNSPLVLVLVLAAKCAGRGRCFRVSLEANAKPTAHPQPRTHSSAECEASKRERLRLRGHRRWGHRAPRCRTRAPFSSKRETETEGGKQNAAQRFLMVVWCNFQGHGESKIRMRKDFFCGCDIKCVRIWFRIELLEIECSNDRTEGKPREIRWQLKNRLLRRQLM